MYRFCAPLLGAGIATDEGNMNKRATPFPRFSMAKRAREPVTATSLYDNSPEPLSTDNDACNSNKYTKRYSGTSCFSAQKTVYPPRTQQPPCGYPPQTDFHSQQGYSYPPQSHSTNSAAQYQPSRQAQYPVAGPPHSQSVPNTGQHPPRGTSAAPGAWTGWGGNQQYGGCPPDQSSRPQSGGANHRGGLFGEQENRPEPPPPAPAVATPRRAPQQQTPVKKQYSGGKKDSLCILTATAKSVQYWSDQTKTAGLLFEVFGVLQAGPEDVEASCKAFSLAASDGVLQCRYYEMDCPFPASGRSSGALLRCLGSWDSARGQLRCVSVRPSSPKEQLLAKKLIALSDAEMRERVSCGREQ